MINGDKVGSNLANPAVQIHFYARKVYAVIGSNHSKPILVPLLLNGKPLVQAKGSSVFKRSILVDKHTLYEAVILPETQVGVFANKSG
ncbi:MAG: hypothetical protein PSV35_02425 [bacterium]|nr:hypothetical protein [bacterium]